MTVIDHDLAAQLRGYRERTQPHHDWLQAKEFDLLHDRFDRLDTSVAKLHVPVDGLDLIIYALFFVSGWLACTVFT